MYVVKNEFCKFNESKPTACMLRLFSFHPTNCFLSSHHHLKTFIHSVELFSQSQHNKCEYNNSVFGNSARSDARKIVVKFCVWAFQSLMPRGDPNIIISLAIKLIATHTLSVIIWLRAHNLFQKHSRWLFNEFSPVFVDSSRLRIFTPDFNSHKRHPR